MAHWLSRSGVNIFGTDPLDDGTKIGLTAPQGSDTNLGIFVADGLQT